MALEFRFRSLWLLATILVIFSCSDKEDPQPDVEVPALVEATSLGSWPVANLKLIAQLAGMDLDFSLLSHDVQAFRIVYRTTYKGADINASGLILLPKTTGSMPMISFHRGTTVEQADAPSAQALESEDVLSYSALTSMGFITVVPDMIGFGASKDIFHPYYVEEPTSDAVIDMLRAARELAEDNNLEFDQRLFLAGYSQGGYITMATHKALEAEPVEGFEVIASFPGAGGYDISGMLNMLRPAQTYPDPYYLAYIGMSYRSYYDETDLITSFFNEPFASKIPGLFNGVNSGSQINNQLTDNIPGLIRAEILSNNDAYAANQFLEEKFEENSPIDWTPSAPIFMYHGSADAVVPLQNSEVTYDRLLSNGADPDKIELIVFPGESHGSAVVPYIEDVIRRLEELR